MNRVAAVLLVIAFAGCTHDNPVEHDSGRPPSTTRTDAPARPAAASSSSSSSGLSDRIVALAPVAGRPGTFEATLEDRKATLTLALNAAPIAYRRPLAFSRLATALGFHVVPASVARTISVGELGALLADQPAQLEFVRAQVRVQNDGTVDALLTGGLPWAHLRGHEIDPRDSFEVRSLARAAASPVPVDGERSPLVRDFVEMLVLDYLAAFAVRRSVVLLADAGVLVLDDNREAFPAHVDATALIPILHRLRDVARFPRGVRDALLRLDRTRAEALFAPQGFETWLLSPRGLIELDERRAGLLSLIEVQIAQRGEGAVMTL